jgi:hypothetical protein
MSRDCAANLISMVYFSRKFSAEGDISGLLIASVIYNYRGEGHAYDF